MLLTLEEFDLVKNQLEKETMKKIASEVGVSLEQVARFFELSSQSQAGFHIKKGVHGCYIHMDDPSIFEAACKQLN